MYIDDEKAGLMMFQATFVTLVTLYRINAANIDFVLNSGTKCYITTCNYM